MTLRDYSPLLPPFAHCLCNTAAGFSWTSITNRGCIEKEYCALLQTRTTQWTWTTPRLI